MVYVLLAPGFEESEAVVPTDLLRQAGLETALVSLSGPTVSGSHGITLCADLELSQVDLSNAEMLVLPGGLGGVEALWADDRVSTLIQEAAGKSLQEIINEDGMEVFKALEEQVLCGVSASHTVIATGGSAVYYPKAMEHLKKLGRIVYIQVSVETILQRLNNITTRGVAMSKDQGIRELYEERRPLYETYAEVTVRSGSGSMEDTVADIIDEVSRLRQSFR